MNPADKARADLLRLPGWRAALGTGFCAGCSTQWRMYDPIAYDPYHHGWISACCADLGPPTGDAA